MFLFLVSISDSIPKVEVDSLFVFVIGVVGGTTDHGLLDQTHSS